MKMVRFLFLLLTTLGLAATVQADPSFNILWLNSDLEDSKPVSVNGIPATDNFSRPERGYYFEKPAPDSPLMAALSGANRVDRIQLKIGNQHAASSGSYDAAPYRHAAGDGRMAGPNPITLQSDSGPIASMNISFQPEGNLPANPPSNYLSVDAYAGAAELKGSPSGVPEPDTMMLLGFGLLALAGIGRRFTRT